MIRFIRLPVLIAAGLFLCAGCSRHGPSVLNSDNDEEEAQTAVASRPATQPAGDGRTEEEQIAVCEARVKAHCRRAGEYRREVDFFRSRLEMLDGYYRRLESVLETFTPLMEAGRQLKVHDRIYSPDDLKQLWGRARDMLGRRDTVLGEFRQQVARIAEEAERSEAQCALGQEMVGAVRRRINEIESKEALLATIRAPRAHAMEGRQRDSFEVSLTSALAQARASLVGETAALSQMEDVSVSTLPPRARIDRAVIDAGRLDLELKRILDAAATHTPRADQSPTQTRPSSTQGH
ncbi:MAG: hypothetical protein JSU68_11560 [Phycisphaerales bacterium]|nr:MAG: hypothetical protein JSU68_11560 [Phycisphaerales bacterium]